MFAHSDEWLLKKGCVENPYGESLGVFFANNEPQAHGRSFRKLQIQER